MKNGYLVIMHIVDDFSDEPKNAYTKDEIEIEISNAVGNLDCTVVSIEVKPEVSA